MLAALAIFFASSAVCATAKTMQELIIGRAFQGTAGGGLILLVHVCISDLFSLRQRSLLMVSRLLHHVGLMDSANTSCVGLYGRHLGISRWYRTRSGRYLR